MTRRTTMRGLLCLSVLSAVTASAQPCARCIAGVVLDPVGRPIPGVHIELKASDGDRLTLTTQIDGSFKTQLPALGAYTVSAAAEGFSPVTRNLELSAPEANIRLQLGRLAVVTERVTVSSSANDIDLSTPDPSERVMVREELLDGNPGRPGAPVSLPGLPIETASGGIKAPQYFVPGVAGDHGEPIAQYLAVGGYRVPNNLSANAHGNGYADPDIMIAATLESVQTDGGAFNVLEGNHALNLAATYGMRPRLAPFITLTGDYRDLDLATDVAPANPERKEWLALDVAYGNGLLERLEHRQQYKWNAMRVAEAGRHELTLMSIGYWGQSYVDGLVPLGMGKRLGDTLDPRQHDQTHTTVLAADDLWRATTKDALSFSGFFRTYNLTLFSNFGEGLIRQSEFRTVDGLEVREEHSFAPWLAAMAGLSYNQDNPRRDDLDHYFSGDASTYGPFVKVLANNLRIGDIAPYLALRGSLGSHLRLYAGLRHDQIEMRNADRLRPSASFDLWRGFENPKATLAWTPGGVPARWLPQVSFSIGQSFFTEDPRVGLTINGPSGAAALASPFERSHSAQLVIEKAFLATDVRVTLGRTTTTATLAKIDPDVGLPQDLGPGRLRYLTVSARRQFSFGSLQGVVSKADARDQSTGIVTPEAPRTIVDGLAAVDRLPLGLRARSEYADVGRKLLDVGGFEAVPVKELRLAVVRPVWDGRIELGANAMWARGYTGQTTETFASGWLPGGAPPACPAGVNGVANDFDCGSVERSVGVRLPSFVGASISWRFRRER